MATLQSWNQINSASERVEQNLKNDSKFKTIGDLLKASVNQPSLSGLQDVDYPNMLNLTHRIPIISNIQSIPLPSEVIEQFRNMQHNCALGIFPEINRAWLSIDSSIYFWAYDNASDVAYYNGLDQTILSVNLFKPRPNVFKSHIKYLLCLVTAQEITLLGVTCEDVSEQQQDQRDQYYNSRHQSFNNLSISSASISTIFVIPDPISKLSTDNVMFSVLSGTDDGRIFLGANDGCLYEIVYQAEDGWIWKKCRIINHSYSLLSYVTPSFLNFSEQEPIAQIEIDSSRHLLYVRTEKSTIQLYDLGHDGQSIKLVTSKTLSAVVNQASCIARTIDTSNFKPIVGIKAITKSESENIHLVAVTQAGVRLYFSACGSDRPTSLHLVHVRLPPGFTSSSAMQRPNSVSNIYHRDNTFIMTSSQSDTKDFLWVMSNDFYVYEDQMMEVFSVTSLGGKVWSIAEEVRPSITKSCEIPTPPLVVKQHYEERRKFILLTSEGVHIFYKQRPIDQLNILLLENQGPESLAVRSFFQSTKLTEACLTSLILASSSNLPQEIQLVEWSTLAFFRYGGEPRAYKSGGYQSTINHHNNSFMPSMSTPISSPISHHLTSATGFNVSPIASHQQQHYNNGVVSGEQMIDVQFSARHDAVYLYLARILRPIWALKVASTQTMEGNQKYLVNTATIEEISMYLKRMTELRKFLDVNMQFIGDSRIGKLNGGHNGRILMNNDLAVGTSSPGPIGDEGNANTNEPINLEKDSLGSLLRLLTRCIEVLNLYKLLYEHQFSTVCANLTAEPQLRLSNMTFKDMIVLGNDMTTNIASALVRRYLDDNITTDAISRRLHELCPSIFRQENALQAKAHEMILQSRAIVDKVDKDRMMNEAVSLLKKIGIRLELQSVCELLHSARAHKYIVDICLFVAEKRDPLNLACFKQTTTKSTLLYNSQMNNSNHHPVLDDGEERTKAQAIAYRMDCYMKIIDTLDRLINSEDFNEVFDSCTKSVDELFHTKLYEWLCEKNLSAKLLEVQSPYVESFLKAKAEADNANFSANYLDLIWRFYERRGNFFNAAQILDRLASRPSSDYGLDERLEYLSRAKGCVEAMAAPGEYSHELEEKMEVVRIQIQVYKKLKELPDTPAVQEAIAQLNYSLSDLTQLYQNYAQKFSLYDCQLAILKCGNHYDSMLIEKLWKNIIDEILNLNQQESQDTQLHILSNRIEGLGKMLMPSERFFPVYFIISYLEYKTYTYGNLRWVPQCMVKIGFKPINLLDPYHKFYKSREHSVYWAGKSVHVLKVIACLIESSLSKSDRSFANACLDVICDYLIDLQTMVASDLDARKLQETFTVLQSRINQLLN